MIAQQLMIDGGEVPHPPPRATSASARLSDGQRDILRLLRAQGEITSTAAGELIHAHRSGLQRREHDRRAARHPYGGAACCAFACADGRDAMMRLRARGLVERFARGRWRLRPEVGGPLASPLR